MRIYTKAAKPKWSTSQWCRDRNSDHSWCMNRNSEESHCICACHMIKAEVEMLRGDIESIERLIDVKSKRHHRLTRLYL